MRKHLFFILLIVGLLVVGGSYLYSSLMPELIAKAMLSDDKPAYIPKRILSKVEEISRPINEGTEAILQRMHDAEIPVDDVLRTVDSITEEQAYAFIDEVNKSKPKTADEVFDLATRHFNTTFNPEVLREPFKEHFDVKQIRKLVVYANLNRSSREVDFATAKAIVKQIIIEKEKELR